MFQKLNIQYLLSYLGLIPFIILIINKYFLFQIKEEIYLNFIIYYTLIIIVFIGSTNWNLELKIKNHIAIYGFLPSLISVILIFLNLNNYDPKQTIIILIFVIMIQLLLDYFIIFSNKFNKTPFYFLRVPLTLNIIIFLIIFRL